MKTTLDLPVDLIREVKLRSVNEGRKLKDLMADLLRQGLKTGKPRTAAMSNRVKLPLIQCRQPAELTPQQVADELSKQETSWHHEAS